MKEVFTMWRHTQLVVLVALSAAIYAAVLIPFKGFPIVPGYIELRPANAFPVVFGLLFGPAGAWGAAIGNLIGDFFGTLTLGSVGGFVGNFFLAYLPYKMWGAYFRSDENIETNVDSGKKFGVYILVTILASVDRGGVHHGDGEPRRADDRALRADARRCDPGQRGRG